MPGPLGKEVRVKIFPRPVQKELPLWLTAAGNPETFQMDARKLEAAITPRTRAIVPVHLGGNSCDLDAILAIGARRSVPVLEDACQAHGATYAGRRVAEVPVVRKAVTVIQTNGVKTQRESYNRRLSLELVGDKKMAPPVLVLDRNPL